jgi:hypothetical protein
MSLKLNQWKMEAPKAYLIELTAALDDFLQLNKASCVGLDTGESSKVAN